MHVLHGESNTSQASPRMTIQRMCQPQEAARPNKTKSYSNPTPPRKRQNNPINGHACMCMGTEARRFTNRLKDITVVGGRDTS